MEQREGNACSTAMSRGKWVCVEAIFFSNVNIIRVNITWKDGCFMNNNSHKMARHRLMRCGKTVPSGNIMHTEPNTHGKYCLQKQ